MRSHEFSPPNYRFVTHTTDSYRGQTNYITSMIVDGREVGSVEYSVYRDQPQIDMIYIEPEYRRKGYASILVKELQRLYPDQEIKISMTTPDGTKFFKSLRGERQIDQKIEDKHRQLQSIRGELTRLTNKLETLMKTDPDKARKWLSTVSDRWNKLHDLEHRVEQQVADIGSSTKRFFR